MTFVSLRVGFYKKAVLKDELFILLDHGFSEIRKDVLSESELWEENSIQKNF